MNKINQDYKIYGRRRGRKKKRLHLAHEFLFKNNNKINLFKKNYNILDIGSGSGENSIHLSSSYPNSQIVACETFLDGNLNLCNEIISNNIKNITIYNGNVKEFLDNIKKQDIIDHVWILFPDPWPKKRHFKRRLINNNFIIKLVKFLKTNGIISIVTDSQSYLRQILSTVYKQKKLLLWVNQTKISWEIDNHIIPETKFYKKAIKCSRKPIYIELKKL